MKTIIVMLLLLTTFHVVQSCYSYNKAIELERKQRALRLTTPGSPLPQCDQWYNNGHSKEWANCMGVKYR